jgi:hypothetical protein
VGYRNVNFMFGRVYEAAGGDIPDHLPAGGSAAHDGLDEGHVKLPFPGSAAASAFTARRTAFT